MPNPENEFSLSPENEFISADDYQQQRDEILKFEVYKELRGSDNYANKQLLDRLTASFLKATESWERRLPEETRQTLADTVIPDPAIHTGKIIFVGDSEIRTFYDPGNIND